MAASANAHDDEGNRLAPEGMVWRCDACGKRSRDRYGLKAIDRGYDGACMLNAVLVGEADAAADAAKGGRT